MDQNCRRVLDVGCGAGDNAALLKSRIPLCEVYGITRSMAEAELARKYMTGCWVADLEGGIPEGVQDLSFDAILFSHVLEHLRDPAGVVARFSQFLRKGGQVVIAVPNVLFLPVRLGFLRGNFQYDASGGILDDTHLHFYTYFTADRYLLAGVPGLELKHKGVGGHVSLPLLRGRVIPDSFCKRIDTWGLRHWPNLFGAQIILEAVKC